MYLEVISNLWKIYKKINSTRNALVPFTQIHLGTPFACSGVYMPMYIYFLSHLRVKYIHRGPLP